MAEFGWVEGARISRQLNPQEVGEALERIRARGALSAQAVVAEASSPTSPLHSAFEWDDRMAAGKYRLDQARHLIRSVSIRRQEGFSEPMRAYVSINRNGTRSVYERTEDALRDKNLRAQILERAQAELDSFARRYGHIRELVGVIEAIEEQKKQGFNKKAA